jgi:hypothetical protein
VETTSFNTAVQKQLNHATVANWVGIRHAQWVLLHITVWTVYKSFLYYINVVRGGIPDTVFWAFTAFSTLIEPVIFYTYYFYLIPRILEEKRIAIFLLVSIAIISFVPIPAIYYVNYLREVMPGLPDELRYPIPYFSHHLGIGFNLLLFICLASGARFGVDWFKNQHLKLQLEKQNQLSEMALLRSQINPHFLFNTLNNIYSLSYKQDANAPQAILKLSELMRYMLYEAGEDTVPLSKEIQFIQNYVALQRLRLKNPGIVQLEIIGNHHSLRIAPMLMIPFIENAFKHGVSPQNPALITFRLTITQNAIELYTQNKITHPQTIKQNTEESGIGLKNVQRRLLLLYPNQHQISIQKDSENYAVMLHITL